MIWLWKHDEPPKPPVMTVPPDAYEDALRRIFDQAHEGDEYREWGGPTAGGTNAGPRP